MSKRQSPTTVRTLTRTIDDHKIRTKERFLSYTHDKTNFLPFLAMYIVTKRTGWINLMITVKSQVSVATSKGFKLSKK